MSEFENNLNAKIVSTMEETDKKCPNCSGVMDFDPATGGLGCSYCGYKEAIKKAGEQPEKAEELDFSKAESVENCNWGAEKKTVICEACGAESVYDTLEIASVCPFCGSNQVMEAADQKTMAPGGVVPFQITDKRASELFRTWMKRRWFCPKLAKESAKARHFKGIYLPYWTFDAKTYSEYEADYGKDRRVRVNKDETKIVTDWYFTRGDYREAIDDELICATTNHSQSMLSGLEPFHTAENKSYKPEYVAGFAAERYAVGIKEAWSMAKESIHYKLSDNIERLIRSKNHADHVRSLKLQTRFSDVTYKYLLLPVWISSYRYKDKVYQFMVNGQTGKVSGKTPISIPKVVGTVITAIAIIALIFWLSQYR